MTQEEKVIQEILAAKTRSLNTGEPLPSRSSISFVAIRRHVFQQKWVHAHKAYKEAEAEILAFVVLQREIAVAAKMEELTALWIDYQQEGTFHATHPYNQAISRIGDILCIRNRNRLIDWLDDRHPDWRGYAAPKVIYQTVARGAA